MTEKKLFRVTHVTKLFLYRCVWDETKLECLSASFFPGYSDISEPTRLEHLMGLLFNIKITLNTLAYTFPESETQQKSFITLWHLFVYLFQQFNYSQDWHSTTMVGDRVFNSSCGRLSKTSKNLLNIERGKLKVENLAQATPTLSPVSFCAVKFRLTLFNFCVGFKFQENL